MVTKLLGILVVIGLWSGCGKEIKVYKESKDELNEEYQYYNHPENNSRIKEGWYKAYYKNGEYLEVGTYKDNQRIGEWSYFTEDGKETKGIYKDAKKWSGEFWINVTVDSGGSWIETETEIQDENEVYRGLFTHEGGLWNGLFVIFWTNGNKGGEGTYKAGKREGKWVWYSPSGTRGVEINYLNGKLEGKKIFYFENGQISREGNYKDGKKTGKWVWYEENGQISVEGNYKDGKKTGKWVEYGGNGPIKEEGNYKDEK